MKHILYCLLSISLGVAIPAAGQVTITSGDVASHLLPGTSITSRIDTGTHTANMGTLGATSWDFSGLNIFYSATTVAVRPDTTAFFSLFPTATHAIKIGTGYSYYTLGSTFQLLGYAQPPPSEIRTKETPGQILQQLPLTMGTTWTATYTDSSFVTISGTTYTSATNHVVVNTVDAYGNLTFPGGSIHQVLRLKSDRHSTVGVHTSRSITYQFLAQDGAVLSVVPSDTNQPETGTISAGSFSWSLPAAVTAVEQAPAGTTPSRFTLEQNFPNPFNPTTTIQYSVAENSYVTISIFDLLGQELTTLVSAQRAPGKYSVQWNAEGIAGGVYLCRLESGGVVDIKRLILLR